MADTTIDSLDIEIKASAAKANKAIDNLCGKLEKLSGALGGMNVSRLGDLSNGIAGLADSMQKMKLVGTADFTRLTKNIDKLGAVDSVGLSRSATALQRFANSLAKLDGVKVSDNAAQIGTIANGIKQLGYKSATQAIENIPKLSSALRDMMNTLSKAPAVSQNLVDMTNALANLSTSIRGTRAASAKSGSGVIRLTSLFNGLTKSTHKSIKGFKSFAQISGYFYANFYSVIRGINKAWSSALSSMDYVETFNYWNVTLDKLGTEFGKDFEKFGYDSAEAYVNSFSSRLKDLTKKMTGYNIGDAGDLTLAGNMNLGLDPERLMNFQAKIGAVTNSVGLCGETSINTAKALSMLSADMSSFTNEDLSSVMTNFQSGLIGQSRALYKFGIDITNATLQQYAYNLGVTKSLSAMTQAEKMQLRLIAILDQSKVAWGDQANTINSVANQYRIFKQQASNLARVLGNLFLPIVKKVLPVVNGLVIAMNRLLTTLGFKVWGENWLKDLQDGISDGFSGDDVDDFTDSVDDATTAVNKLKTATLGIDELNIINDQSSSNSSSGDSSGSVDLSGAISDALKEYESVWNEALADSENKAKEVADRICNAFKEGDYEGVGERVRDGIINGLGKIDWENDVYPKAGGFGTGIAEYLNGLFAKDKDGNTVFSEIGETIAGALNTVVLAVFSFSDTFEWADFGEALKGGVQSFINDADLAKAGYTVGNLVKGISTSVYTAVKDKETWKQLGKKIAAGINGFLVSMKEVDKKTGKNGWQALAGSLNGFADGILETLREALKDLTWEDVFSGIGDFLGDLKLSTVGVVIAGFALKNIPKTLLNLLNTKISAKLAGNIGSISITLGKVVIAGVAAWEIGFNLGKEIGKAMFPEDADAYDDFSWGGFFDAVKYAMDNNELWEDIVGTLKETGKGAAADLKKEANDTIGTWWNDPGNMFRDIWEFPGKTITSLWNKKDDDSTHAGAGTTLDTEDSNKIKIDVEANITSAGVAKDLKPPKIDSIAKFSEYKDGIKGTKELNKYNALIEEYKDKIGTEKKLNGYNANLSTFTDGLSTEDKKNNLKNFNANLSTFTDGLSTSDKKNNLKNFNANLSTYTDGISKEDKKNNLKNFNANLISFTDGIKSTKNLKDYKALISNYEDKISKKYLDGYNALVKSFTDSIPAGNKKLTDFVIEATSIIAPTVGTDDKSTSGSKKVEELLKKSKNGKNGNGKGFGYATGGYPVSGEMFIARENGLTEMVGSIGHRSAVANNDQIVAGIQYGVEAAVGSVLAPYLSVIAQNTGTTASNTAGGMKVAVKLDSREMVSAYESRKERNGYNFKR